MKNFFITIALVCIIMVIGTFQTTLTGNQIRNDRIENAALNTHSNTLSGAKEVLPSENSVTGVLRTIHYDDPVNPYFKYILSTTDGGKIDLTEQQYSSLISSADKEGFITVNSNGLAEYGLSITGNSVASPRSLPPRPYLPIIPSNIGKQSVIVILGSNETQNLTPSLGYYSFVFDEVNNFIKENSFQQTWLTGNVSGWHRLNDTYIDQFNVTHYLCDSSGRRVYGDWRDVLDIADPVIDYTQYDTIITVGPCGDWPPAASVGPIFINTGDGVVYARRVELPILERVASHNLSAFVPRTIIAHEMGHGFGVGHADAYRSCNPPFQIAGDTNCLPYNYGDPFDTMGGSFYSLNASPHYSTEHKYEMGWINPIFINSSNLSSLNLFINPVETSRNNVIYIHPYEFKHSSSRDNNTFYSIEYRMPIGFDQIMDLSWPAIEQGVYMRYHEPGQFNPGDPNALIFASQRLVDLHPQTIELNDSYLRAGENYTDFANNMTIEVINTSLTGAVVSISRF